MASKDDVKKLLKDVSETRKEISVLRTELNALNEKKESLFDGKEKFSKDIKSKISEIRKLKRERDEYR